MTKELTKQDALDIMRLYYGVQAAQADLKELMGKRDALAQALVKKYRVSLETHQLDLDKGRFVEKPAKPKLVEAGGKANG